MESCDHTASRVPNDVIDKSEMGFSKGLNKEMDSPGNKIEGFDFKSRNRINKLLFSLIDEKRSNLCLAVDLTKSSEILDVADKMGPYIIALKTHVNSIKDFDSNFIKELVALKRKHNFLIFEDRKFSDIGTTVLKQYTGGIYRIQDWADLVTSHVIEGTTEIEALMKGLTSSEPRGVLLVSQMSHKGSLVDGKEMASKIAQKYPEFVSGFISQSKVMDDPRFIQFTPGVNIGSTGDGLGQQYVTPEEAIFERNADLIIVGRGVLKAKEPLKMLLEFKERSFEPYENRKIKLMKEIRIMDKTDYQGESKDSLEGRRAFDEKDNEMAKIDKRKFKETDDELDEPTIEATKKCSEFTSSNENYNEFIKIFEMNPVSRLLFSLIDEKKSNLCLAVDLTKSSEILDVADKMGPYIIALKIHVDIIEDFNSNFIKELVALKRKHNFLIFEDSRFSDIGATVLEQYAGGIYQIQDWADLVTSQMITGITTIEALKKGVTSSEPRGVLIVSQMSHKGSLLDGSEMTSQIAQQYPEFVSGFISQSKAQSIFESDADVIIVGREGILQEHEMLLEFRKRAFECYTMKNTSSQN